jgi:hypothetical protein
MKYNLKNRPKLMDTKYKFIEKEAAYINTETKSTFYADVKTWFERFEKELREALDKHKDCKINPSYSAGIVMVICEVLGVEPKVKEETKR